MMKKIIVLGGGPAGYVTAIRAAQLGAQVHIVEKHKFGGTCLNVGCIPTKALLHSAEIYQQVIDSKNMGIEVKNVVVNWDKILENKNNVVGKLVGGVESLLRANKVCIHKGVGKIKDRNTVIVDDKEEVEGDCIIVATGSKPMVIPFEGHQLSGVIDSTGALNLDKMPKSIVIVGGGVIGVEFAEIFSAFGCEVKIVELLPEILPMLDHEIREEIKKELKNKGVEIFNSAKLNSVTQKNNMLLAKIEQGEKHIELDCEYVLVATGRTPVTENIGMEDLGINWERGRIKVDENFETNIKGIYAIGDCNGKLMLAHAASAQGIAAVEHVLGKGGKYYENTVPSCIYTNPEMASVGLTEEEAKKRGIAVKVGRFSLAGNGKAMIENGGNGLVKLVVGEQYGEILGMHIIGPRATEMIAEGAIAIRLEATVEEVASTIHAHPTVSEAVVEAALDVERTSIHWPPRKG